jgi:C4-dicarboxylate-binding protein DctP
MPFIFVDYAHVDRVLDGPIGEGLLAGLTHHGLRGLAFMDGGFRLFATTHPVRTLADFRGLRIRTLQNRTYIDLVKALHAIPVPAGINKIYEMVQRGFIDAADRSYPTYWSLRLYDVLKYITETNHAYAAKVFIINERFYTGLPADVRAIVKRAAIEAAHLQRQIFRREIGAVKKEAAAHGVHIIALSPSQREAFEAASRPIQEEVTRIVGRDLVDQVRSLRR